MMYGHYFGPNNVDNMASTVYANIRTMSYNGERKKWTFEKYMQMGSGNMGML
jgi:hypothetical protein